MGASRESDEPGRGGRQIPLCHGSGHIGWSASSPHLRDAKCRVHKVGQGDFRPYRNGAGTECAGSRTIDVAIGWGTYVAPQPKTNSSLTANTLSSLNRKRSA